jgi:hypothetical protein
MAARNSKTRIAVFGSCCRGAALIHELHHGPLSRNVEVVGVVTDSPPSFKKVSDTRLFRGRIWKHLFNSGKESYERARLMVPRMLERYSIDRYVGKIRVSDRTCADGRAENVDEPNDAFWRTLAKKWKPDLILTATFGQRIPTGIANYPRLGCFNFHPSTYVWPSLYKGGNPFDQLLADQCTFFVVTMHEVVWEFDSGPMHARSGRIPILTGSSALDLYMLSAIPTVQLALNRVEKIIRDD